MFCTGNNSNNMSGNNSNVFINPKAISMWMLVVNSCPIFRTEFNHMATDEEVCMLNGGAEILLNELKSIKDGLDGKEIV